MVTLMLVLTTMDRKIAGVIMFRLPSLRVEGVLFNNYIHIYINGANSKNKNALWTYKSNIVFMSSVKPYFNLTSSMKIVTGTLCFRIYFHVPDMQAWSTLSNTLTNEVPRVNRISFLQTTLRMQEHFRKIKTSFPVWHYKNCTEKTKKKNLCLCT